MEQLPVRQQFVPMQFRPCLDQSPLFLGKRAGDQVHRANRENGGGVLKISMEMSDVVRRAGFGEHSDDNAKKAGEFRHNTQSYSSRGGGAKKALQAHPALPETVCADDEVVADAVRVYLEKQSSWAQFVERNERRAKEMGITEDDVDHLIAEYRAKSRQRGR